MAFSRSHNVTAYFLLVLIPYAASISFNFTNIVPENQNRQIITEGNGAYISDSGIQVTPNGIGSDQSSKAGRAIYFEPFHLWDNRSNELASFSTSFTFVIDSNGATYYADGLTFFLAQHNSVIKGGGCMGLPIDLGNYNSTIPFVAVEFDTFPNQYCDPRDSNNTLIRDHVGISISSLFSRKHQKWFSNVTGGGECQAWITYNPTSQNLSVSFTGFQNNATIIQAFHYIIDLTTVLPEWVIFGFSAATGSLFELNTVRSWNFSSSRLQVDENNTMPPNPTPTPTPTPTLTPTLTPTPTPNLNPGSDSVDDNNRKVGLVVGLLVAVAILAVLALVLWRRRKNRSLKEEDEELRFDIEMNNEFEMGTGPKKFSYEEIVRSTGEFSEKEKLGEGGFGGVYRGFLKDSNTYIAVKRVSKSSRQGIKEYASEVKIISRLRHRNLVQLTGWCHEKGELLLVYEFMENGSLDSHLFKEKSLLTWGTRYKIAHGLASALLYLHEEWEQCVLHRDIKSSNVMLDSNFNAKLGDFGLAKLVDHEKGSQTTMLAGTLGYMAPECVVTGKATKESDVFSFGVVALEIACGRKPINHRAPEKQIRLTQWVWELYGTGTPLEAVDPRLDLAYDVEEIKRLMILGLWCVHPDSDFRPSMRQAIQVLNSELSLPILPSKMPVASYLSSPTSGSYSDASIIQTQSSNNSFFMGRS